jgi:hypothetical protein
MMTDDLIEALAERLEPVSPRAPLRRMALWIAGGAAVSAAAMLLWLGLRPDFMAASLTVMFWVKFAYTLALGVLALWAAERLGRPGLSARRPALAGLAVVSLVVLIAAAELMLAPMPERRPMLMGHSAMICPWRILALTAPLLVAAILALRGFAPTRPALAGLAAGLGSGALAAFVYAFSCNESAMPFVAACYTLPVLAAGLVGALVGRYALRW